MADYLKQEIDDKILQEIDDGILLETQTANVSITADILGGVFAVQSASAEIIIATESCMINASCASCVFSGFSANVGIRKDATVGDKVTVASATFSVLLPTVSVSGASPAVNANISAGVVSGTFSCLTCSTAIKKNALVSATTITIAVSVNSPGISIIREATILAGLCEGSFAAHEASISFTKSVTLLANYALSVFGIQEVVTRIIVFRNIGATVATGAFAVITPSVNITGKILVEANVLNATLSVPGAEVNIVFASSTSGMNRSILKNSCINKSLFKESSLPI